MEFIVKQIKKKTRGLRAVSLLLATAFVMTAAFCAFSLPVFAAGEGDATIVGNSVYRTSATNATVKFLSSTAGTAYYCITETAIAPSTSELADWTNGGAVTANETKTLALTTTSGAKHVHMVVENGGSFGNVLTVSMPSDYCYIEDFDAYLPNTYIAQSGSHMFPISQINGGTGDSNQKVANGVGTNSTKMLSLSSAPSWASDQVVHLETAQLTVSNGYVFEGDVYVLSEESAWQARFSVTDGDYEGNHEAGIFFKNGKILAINDSLSVLADSYTANEWHHVKLVMFPSALKYKVYFDGVLLADDLALPSGIDRLAFTAGHGKTAYYDNFAFYQTDETYYFNSFSVTLGTDIAANCFADLRGMDPSRVQVRFTMNEKTVTVDGTPGEGGHKFVFDRVAPQCMGDRITAELLFDDRPIDVGMYTVLGYLNELKAMSKEQLGYTEAKYNAMTVLIDDMLVYGGAAQTYTGYKTSALVSEGVTGSGYTELTEAEARHSLENNGTNITFKAATLYFDNVNRLKIRFTAEDTEGLVIKYCVNGDTESTLEFVSDGEGYLIVTPDIYAVGFDDVYTFTAYKNDSPGAVLYYSVRAYVYAMQGSASTSMAGLAKAIYTYGLSAKAFANET